MKKILERHKKTRSGQRGGMLLEVLVSVLLFALGIVALVGLQGRSLVVTDDVQYRAEAMHFANAYIGEIWAVIGRGAGALSGADVHDRFEGDGGTGGASYDAFSTRVMSGIPGANPPRVVITDRSQLYTDFSFDPPVVDSVLLPSVSVDITISWVDREDAGVTRQFTQTSSVGYPPIGP